jgi:hypothetical protein
VIGEDALIGGDPGQPPPLDELDPEPIGAGPTDAPDDQLRDGLI